LFISPDAHALTWNDTRHDARANLVNVIGKGIHTRGGGGQFVSGMDSPNAHLIQASVGVHPPSWVGVVPNYPLGMTSKVGGVTFVPRG
jgi:hypothetical protein